MRATRMGGALLLLIVYGCATESTTPPMANYLLAGASAGFADQVEVLKGSLVQLRSGDVLLQAQAQLIEDSVAVQFFVINLSNHPLHVTADAFALLDAQGAPCRSLTIKEVLAPVGKHAAQLEQKATEPSGQTKSADAVVNPTGAYDGGSTNERLAKTLRGEADRLEKTLEPPFVRAEVPINKKISGMLYFEHPAAWPTHFKVQLEDQTLAADFLRAVVHP